MMSWEKAAPEYWMGRKDAYQDVLLIIKGLKKPQPEYDQAAKTNTAAAARLTEMLKVNVHNAALRAVEIAIKEIDNDTDTISRQ